VRHLAEGGSDKRAMAKIITVTGVHLGSGASTIAANVAVLLAQDGRRVALVDCAISTPTQHLLFGLTKGDCQQSLNDFLLGRCALSGAAIVPNLACPPGRLFVIPANAEVADLGQALRQPYDFDLLDGGYRDLVETLNLDVLIIDAEVGLHESTMASLVSSEAILAVIQLDLQQYPGIGIMLHVAERLGISHQALVVNNTASLYDPDNVRATVEQAFGWKVTGVLPYCDELMALGSGSIFVLRFPDHAMTAAFRQIADALLA